MRLPQTDKLIFLFTFLVVVDLQAGVYGVDPGKELQAQDSVLYYEIFLNYRSTNIDSAYKYSKLSVNQATVLNNLELIVKSYNALGYSYKKLNDIDSALYAYRKGIEYSKEAGLKVREMYFYNSLGLLYDQIAVYDSAIANHYKSLELGNELERPKDISISLNNIGNINYALGNIQSAIGFYLQSADIKEENDFSGLDKVYYNIGLCYKELGDYSSALNYFNKELQAGGTKGILGLGMSYYGLGEYEKAEEYFKTGLTDDDVVNRTIANRYLAEVNMAMKNYESAIVYIDQAIDESKRWKFRELLKTTYKIKGDILREIGESDSAIVYYDLHYAYKDSLFNETVASSIQELFVGLERKQAEQVISTKEREIQVRKRTNFLLVAVIILSAALILRFILDLSKRKRRNEYLDKEVEKKTTELRSVNNNLSIRTRDLDKLIYSISHEIKGPLARLQGLINIGSLDTNGNEKGISYYEMLKSEAENLDNILAKMIIVNNVNHHPVKFQEIDTKKFFTDVLNKTDYIWKDKIDINLDLDGTDKINTDAEMLEISLQNLIDNAVKFRNSLSTNGNCPKLDIKVLNDTDGVDIVVSDNGQGFEERFKKEVTDLFFVANEQGGIGMGLHHTKLALSKIKADLEIASTKDPTTFIIHL